MSHFISLLCVNVLPFLLAIHLHEYAHVWVATWLGDRSAERLGRMNFHPETHLHPVGSVWIPLLSLYLSGIPLGWSRPVPVDVKRLKNPKTDRALIALAGPASNCLQAAAWLLIAHYCFPPTVQDSLSAALSASAGPNFKPFFSQMAQAGLTINLWMGLLHLLPIPPLDGNRVLVGLLPERYLKSPGYGLLQRYGIWLLGLAYCSGTLHACLSLLSDRMTSNLTYMLIA